MALIDVVLAVDCTVRILEPKLAEFGFGRGAFTRRAVAPLVTWIPANDGFEPPEQAVRGPIDPRVTATRLAGCEAHIWAVANPNTPEDFRATETLLHQVVASLRANAPGRALVLIGGHWEDNSAAESTAYGRAYVLSFQVRVPILQIAVQGGPVQVTAVPQTTQIDSTS